LSELTKLAQRNAEYPDGSSEHSPRFDAILVGYLDGGGEHASAETLFAAFAAAREIDPVRAMELGIWLAGILDTWDEQIRRAALLRDLADPPGMAVGPNVRAWLDAELIAALHGLGRLSEARALSDDARDRLTSADAPGPQRAVRVLAETVSVLSDLGDVHGATDALAMLHKTLPAAADTGMAHWHAARAHSSIGEYGRAAQHLTLAIERLTAPMMPLAEWIRFCCFASGLLVETEGPSATALQWLVAAETGARALRLPGVRMRSEIARARFEFAADRSETALRHVEALPEVTQGPLTPMELVEARLFRGRVLMAAEQPAQGAADLRKVIDYCEQIECYRLAMRAWRLLDDTRMGPDGAQAAMPN
jgi:tetratricopeptide (TPR) repeat protein